MNNKRPVRVDRGMVPLVSKTFATAFQKDPLYCWLFPDDDMRKRILPIFFNFRISYGINFGEVYATSKEAEGAAIWIPHTQTNMTKWKMIRSGALPFLRAADKTTMQRINILGKYADDIHHQIAPFPHWHLSPIAVRPESQGMGYARMLLNSMFERLDRENLSCFLETQTPVNVEIYQKYHFTIEQEGKIPGTDIPHWAMVRKPR